MLSIFLKQPTMTRLFRSPLELYFSSIAKTMNTTCLCMRYYWIFYLWLERSLGRFHHPMNSTTRLSLCFLPFLLNCNWCILDLFHLLTVRQLLIVSQRLFLRHQLMRLLQQNTNKRRLNFGPYFSFIT